MVTFKSKARNAKRIATASLSTVVLGMGLLAGCGQAASKAPATSGTTAPATTSSASATSAAAGSLQKVTLNLGFLVLGWQAAFAYGATHGIFKQQGIDLKLVPGTGSETTVESVANGEFPFGLADGTTLAALYSKGVRAVAVGGYLQGSATAIVVAKSSGITSPKQLAGKVLGETPTTDTFEMMPAFLKAVGLPTNSVHYLALGGAARVPAIVAGHAVGDVSLGAIDDGPVLQSKGVPVRYFPFAQYGVNMDETEDIITSPKMLKSNPGLIKRFILATRASVLGAEKHPHAAVQAIAQLFPSAAPSLPVLLQEWKGAEPLLTTPQDKGHVLGWMAPQDWQDAVNLANQYMNLKQKVTATNNLFTNQFEQ